MPQYKLIPLFALAVLCSSCFGDLRPDKIIVKTIESQQDKSEELPKEKPEPITEGTVRLDNEASNTTSEVALKDGMLNGVSKQYYDDGSLWKESAYVDDKLHGVAKVYNKDGGLKREVSYVSGLKHGPYIKYFKSGKKQMEIEYNYDLPMPGIQEIDYRGNAISASKIQVRTEDHLPLNATYHYYFSLEPASKSAKFYLLENKEDWNGRNAQIRNTLLPIENGEGHFELQLEPGYRINTTLYVYAIYPSKSGVEAATMYQLNVNIEN